MGAAAHRARGLRAKWRTSDPLVTAHTLLSMKRILLTGMSGTGKSTVIRALAGTPDDGSGRPHLPHPGARFAPSGPPGCCGPAGTDAHGVARRGSLLPVSCVLHLRYR